MPISDEDLNTIPGWFDHTDRALFRALLPASREICGTGNLVEIGVFMGQSAVLVGDDLGPDETFSVIDLFGSAAADDANEQENQTSYPDLSRQAFEANYLRLHSTLPVVIEDFSERIVEHVPANSSRFVHVDASHLYEHVVKDIASAKTILMEQGIVVFDDYRSAHAPGVAAAVWAAVAERGLHPILLSPGKMYATWGDPEPWRTFIVRDGPLWVAESQAVAGQDVWVINPRHLQPYRWQKYLPPAAVPSAKRARAYLDSLINR